MARKPVLEGGKRDEIIAAATTLFFTEGYEQTSVRKVLQAVGGEIGMFYHYFSSKEELFDIVADRFFRQYEADFKAMAAEIQTPEELIGRFLSTYETALEKYRSIEKNMHWTIRSALHERTLTALIPTAREMLARFGYDGPYPLDIAAAKTVADVSAIIHSESFQQMDEQQKLQILRCLFAEIKGTN